MFGDRQLITRIDAFLEHTFAVHLDSVLALQVFDLPIALLHDQFAVTGGYVGELQAYVSGLAAADDKPILQERDGVSAPERFQGAQ